MSDATGDETKRVPTDTQEQQIEDLVGRTRLRDVLLQRIDGELRRTPPDDVAVRVTAADPWYHVEMEEELLLVRFANRVEYSLPGTTESDPILVGYLEIAHMIEIELDGKSVPSDASIEHFIQNNVLFMAYPYIRAALHRLPAEFGLPAVLLPYLRRDLDPTAHTGEDAASRGPALP